MSIEELSQYALKMHNLLGDDREKRCQARNYFQKGYQFSKEQAFILIPDQRNGELENFNVPEKIISAIKILEITKESNKIQKEHSRQRENEGIDFSDHFSLELVKERLDKYNISNIPDKQALADIMIMLCICPTEIKNFTYLMEI
ncbi:hypothetical protein C1645_831118 [Glomus cerebriforme]|uniref:Uncharacterized protein n=1 Tax=Glomus cerebriforme TaxID=658196 RepID=A0A397SMB0_9GLOM|nr:hypothetical protein C1645_831118 [Glomus cerebriforme]